MKSLIKDAIQEALNIMGRNYKFLESPSYDLFPLTILDAHQSTNVLEAIGSYDDLFKQDIQPIDIISVSEISYTKNKVKNLNIDVTVSFLDGLLKTTKLGKAEISTVFNNVSTFNIELLKIFEIAPRKLQLTQSRTYNINRDSNVVQRILDNQGKCGYFVGNALALKEVSLSGKTDRGLTVKPDVTVLTDLFEKLFPKQALPENEAENHGEEANNGSESEENSNELLSMNGTFKYSVKQDYTLNIKFPEGIIYGIIPQIFRIINEKITFAVDEDTQERLIAEFKKSLINPDEPSSILFV